MTRWALEPGTSAVITRRLGPETIRLYLVHRPESGTGGAGLLIARFNPARQNGQAVSSYATVRVSFGT